MNRIAVPLMFAVTAGCWRAPPPADPVPPRPVRVQADGLENVFRVGDRLFSGGSPDGDVGFAALLKLGVKTVISVDGATPDVDRAARFGLRYVHIPVGYDGVPRAKALVAARATRDLPGPVYVHCHHGIHRGPAAAACVLLALEPGFTPDAAEAWLKDAGTDPKYRGLIGVPRSFARPTAAELDAVPPDFPPVVAVPDLTKLMVAIDARWDALKAAKTAGWPRSADAASEVVQLAELYREAARRPEAAAFRGQFATGETAVNALERAVRAGDNAAAGPAFAAVQATCGRCHAAHRDAIPAGK